MNTGEFLELCRTGFGDGKVHLMPAQRAIYEQKLARFDGQQLKAIFDKCLETCQYFPKVVNVYAAARLLGYLDERAREDRPHEWQPSECQMCAGSGMVAAFYSQAFDVNEHGTSQVLTLEKLVPYHRSPMVKQPDWIRTIFRCSCDSGDVSTIPKGWPRWSLDQPMIRRRAWGR